LHLPPIFGPRLSDGVIWILSLPTPVTITTNFGTKLTTTWPPWKTIACCLHLPPYFWAHAIRWCHLNFLPPPDPCCHGNKFWNKTDYNLAPVKNNCSLFAPTPYFRARAMQWCHVNFSPEEPCCHGNQPLLFKDKIGCRLTKASNAEMQLLGYIAWQLDRSSFHRTYF